VTTVDRVVEERHWWDRLSACPACGAKVSASADASRGRCGRCDLEWSQEGHITEWHAERPVGDERALPYEWIAGHRLAGRAKIIFLAKRALWKLLTLIGFPVRHLVRRKLAAFQRRSLVDRTLAEQWRRHYLKGLALPVNPLMFEYSYRKVEKLGFAALLGFRIAIQDIRRHVWWGDHRHAWFQLVPVAGRYLPFTDSVVDLAFTDGVIFDMERPSLDTFFRECLRILKPGGYLIIWGGNSRARTRALAEIRWHGRIHSLEEVRSSTGAAGFTEIDFSFEGYAPPMFPTVFNMLRAALSPWPFKTYDYDSWLSRWQRPERRSFWLLRLAKPSAVPS